jgi:hypothetical protein
MAALLNKLVHGQVFGAPLAHSITKDYPAGFVISKCITEIDQHIADHPNVYTIKTDSHSDDLPNQRALVEKNRDKVDMSTWNPYAVAIQLRYYLYSLTPRLIHGAASTAITQAIGDKNVAGVKAALGTLEAEYVAALTALLKHFAGLVQKGQSTPAEISTFFRNAVFEGEDLANDKIAYLVEHAQALV